MRAAHGIGSGDADGDSRDGDGGDDDDDGDSDGGGCMQKRLLGRTVQKCHHGSWKDQPSPKEASAHPGVAFAAHPHLH